MAQFSGNDGRSLTYTSSATREPSAESLARLLASARSFNAGLDVTGLLIYRHGTFLQTIEGASTAIDPVFDRIRRDASHAEISVLHDGKVQQRVFPQWAMMNDSELGVSLLRIFLGTALARSPREVTLEQRSMIRSMMNMLDEPLLVDT